MKNYFKHFVFLMIALVFLPTTLSALEGFDLGNWGVGIEGRVAYYRPSSKRVRKIYSDGWADYQLEISKDIGCIGFDNWRAYVGVSGFSKYGHSIGFHDRTKIYLIPVTLGLKYSFCVFPCTTLSFGGGVCYSFLLIKDDTIHGFPHSRRKHFGGVVQSQISYALTDWAYITAFVDYFYQRFHFETNPSYSYYVERHSLNMSGLKVGGGIGLTF